MSRIPKPYFLQTHETKNRPSDSRLPPNPDYTLYHCVVYISCYNSRHSQSLIKIFIIISQKAHSASHMKRTLVLILEVDVITIIIINRLVQNTKSNISRLKLKNWQILRVEPTASDKVQTQWLALSRLRVCLL